MNKELKQEIIEKLQNYDEESLAEIFNIFASNPMNVDYGILKNGVYVYNMMDNAQAAKAVKKFGFDTMQKAVAENQDWMLYAEQDNNGKWRFASKAPSICVCEYAENIIYDMIDRPKDYPAWAWSIIATPLTMLINLS